MSNRELNEDGLRQALAEAIAKAGSQERWAMDAGLSQAYVSNVLHGKVHPGEAITRALGYRRRVTYVPDFWDVQPEDIWEKKHGRY